MSCEVLGRLGVGRDQVSDGALMEFLDGGLAHREGAMGSLLDGKAVYMQKISGARWWVVHS